MSKKNYLLFAISELTAAHCSAKRHLTFTHFVLLREITSGSSARPLENYNFLKKLYSKNILVNIPALMDLPVAVRWELLVTKPAVVSLLAFVNSGHVIFQPLGAAQQFVAYPALHNWFVADGDAFGIDFVPVFHVVPQLHLGLEPHVANITGDLEVVRVGLPHVVEPAQLWHKGEVAGCTNQTFWLVAH